MKIAVLGGGLAGLTAAYELSEHHQISLFEKAPGLGGLASGFKGEGWEWPIERAYHHIFQTDTDILNFAQKTGFNDFYFESPQTASLYKVGDSYKIFPLDSPLDLLKFPLLTPIERVRVGMILAGLKLSPFLKMYEHYTMEEFMEATIGDHAYQVMFGEMIRKKYGSYAGKILATFIWTRLNKRTKKLGYIKGGFQTFIDYLEAENKKRGVAMYIGYSIDAIKKEGDGFRIGDQVFDKILSTLPTPVLTKVAAEIAPIQWIEGLKKIEYLWAQTLIVETDKKILNKTYWLSNCVPQEPIMVYLQHTNFVNASHYGGNHLLYIANYPDGSSPLLKMSEDELWAYFKPYVSSIQTHDFHVKKLYKFQAPFAQPIFSKEFLKYKPDFITSVKNLFVANLDMTYPYDRGTNYAVKLGIEAARIIQQS